MVVFSWNCHPQPHIRVGLLERTLLRIDRCVLPCALWVLRGWLYQYSWKSDRQSYWTQGDWRCIWKQQTNRIPLSVTQASPDSAGERDSNRISPSRWIQVCRFHLIVLDLSLIWLCRYLRALAAMYIRMTFRAVEVYEILEPLLKDFRKLRYRSMGW